MADGEDVQPLVCDNGTGMVKVYEDSFYECLVEMLACYRCPFFFFVVSSLRELIEVLSSRLDLQEMMLLGLYSPAL